MSNPQPDDINAQPNGAETASRGSVLSKAQRIIYMVLGFLMLALGIIGAFLPVMPTTIFIILAAWFFGRSSPAFEAKLLAHPQFGPILIKWREKGAVPVKAKFFACGGMTLGYAIFWWGAQPGLWLALAVGIFMLASALYVVSRPNG